jgi:hypothetical protein
MTRRRIYGVLIFIVFSASVHAQALSRDRARIVNALEHTSGLSQEAEATNYDASNIETLDARVAPDLKLYGFEGATVLKWNTPRGMVTATLYEMSDAPAAYGAYTLQRSTLGGESTPVLIGAASFQTPADLCFWQSNYAVRIEAPRDLQTSIAQGISRNILGRSEKPPVATYLPLTNIVEGSEKYILRPDLIDSSASLDTNALGFDFSAEAATATYRIQGTTAKLLLLLYPTQHIARKHVDELPSNTRGMYVKRAGPLMAIVYGAKNESIASAILDEVSHEFKGTWNEAPPGLALGPMLMTIFTFIGIALAFTLIVGVSYGGLRVFVKRRYPNRLFDRPETMEIIQLKLDKGVIDRQIGDGGGAGTV